MDKPFTFSDIIEKIDKLPAKDHNLRCFFIYASQISEEARTLSAKLEHIWAIAERDLSDFQHKPDGRIQSKRHCIEVDRILYKLIPHPLKEELGFKYLFYLSAAAAVHDHDLALSLSTGRRYGNGHGKVGNALLQEFRRIFDLDRFESKIIGALIQAHAKSDLSHIDNSFQGRDKIRFLASVFVLADICHLYDRTPELIAEYRYKNNIPPAWAGTMSISSDWEISADTIVFQALPLTLKEYISAQESIKYMHRKQLRAAAKRLLKEKGLPFRFSCKFDYAELSKKFLGVLRNRSINEDEKRIKITEAAKAFADFYDFDGIKMLETLGEKVHQLYIPFLGNHRMYMSGTSSYIARAAFHKKLDSTNLCSEIILKNLESEDKIVIASVLGELAFCNPDAVKTLFGANKAIHSAVKKIVKMKRRIIFKAQLENLKKLYSKGQELLPEFEKVRAQQWINNIEEEAKRLGSTYYRQYDESDSYLKSYAIVAAKNLGLRRMNRVFLSIVLDEDAPLSVRDAAVWAVATLGSQRMVKKIQEIAMDVNRSNIVRVAAIWLLGYLDEKAESIALLNRLKNSENEQIAEQAAKSIDMIKKLQ